MHLLVKFHLKGHIQAYYSTFTFCYELEVFGPLWKVRKGHYVQELIFPFPLSHKIIFGRCLHLCQHDKSEERITLLPSFLILVVKDSC